MRRWLGCRGRRYKVGGKRIKGLKARVECECCISRRGPDWAVEVYQLQEYKEEVTVLVGVAFPKKAGAQQGGQLQEWELPRVVSLEKESSEHFKWIQLEHTQHCTDLPRQVTFPAHTEQGKTGQGLEWMLLLIRRRRRMRRRARERQEKKEVRLILKRLRTTLLWLFSRAAPQKNGLCEGSAWGNWDPQEGQQPF